MVSSNCGVIVMDKNDQDIYKITHDKIYRKPNGNIVITLFPKSATRKIPYQSTVKNRLKWLSGVISSLGNVLTTKDNVINTITFNTRRDAFEVMLLLQTLGIRSNINNEGNVLTFRMDDTINCLGHLPRILFTCRCPSRRRVVPLQRPYPPRSCRPNTPCVLSKRKWFAIASHKRLFCKIRQTVHLLKITVYPREGAPLEGDAAAGNKCDGNLDYCL